jgi:hypothetical protein
MNPNNSHSINQNSLWLSLSLCLSVSLSFALGLHFWAPFHGGGYHGNIGHGPRPVADNPHLICFFPLLALSFFLSAAAPLLMSALDCQIHSSLLPWLYTSPFYILPN